MSCWIPEPRRKRIIPKRDFKDGGPTRLYKFMGVKLNSLIAAVGGL